MEGLVFRYHSQDFQAGVEGEAFLSQFLFRVEVAAVGDHPLPPNQILLVHLRLVTDKHLRLEPEIRHHLLASHHQVSPLSEVVEEVDLLTIVVKTLMTIQLLPSLFPPSQEGAGAVTQRRQTLEIRKCLNPQKILWMQPAEAQ